MQLYKLAEWQQSLVARLDNAEDDAALPSEGEVDTLCSAFSEKVEGVCQVLRNYESEAAALEEEEKRLAARKKTASSRAAWLKNYLMASLTLAGENKVAAGIFKVTIQNNSQPSVYVDVPAEKLPPQFQAVKIEPAKSALLDAYKAGNELPSGVSVVYGKHVRVR